MKLSPVFAGAAILMASFAAGAHVRLEKVSPANGSVLTGSPPSFVLSFSGPALLTALWIHEAGEPRQKLRFQLSTEPAHQFTVAAPRLRPGRYEIRWRALGNDSHVAGGQFRFTVLPEHAVGAPQSLGRSSGENPGTSP